MTIQINISPRAFGNIAAAAFSRGLDITSFLTSAARLSRHPLAGDAPAASAAPVAAPRAATTTGHPASTPLVPQAQPDIARAAAHFGLEL